MANLQNRGIEEAKFARRLGALSSRHRRALVGLLGDPPDVGRVPDSFWDRVRREMEQELEEAILLIFLLAAAQHGMEDARGLAQSYASGRAARVANDYAEHSRERLATAGREWQGRIERELPVTGVSGRVASIFGPARDVLVVTSETTAAVSEGGERAVEATVGLSEDDTWFTVGSPGRWGNVCPICRPLHRKKRGVWAAKFPSGPPAHGSCRCWIHYAEEKRGAAAIA